MGRSPLGKEEEVAAVIAKALGDNLTNAFLSKSSWTHARGIAVDGSFRDINAPLRCDYMEAAKAVIQLLSQAERPK